MRKKNPQNLISIKQAVYDITINDGYQNLSMSKIAKKAGVPQATIYLYYESKEKMLTSIYVEARDMLDNQTKVNPESGDHVETEVKRLFTSYSKTLLLHPQQALFMNIVNNTPELIETNVYKEMRNRNRDIRELIDYGQKTNQIADLPFNVIVAFTFDSLNSLLEYSYSSGVELTDSQIKQAVNLCWKVMEA